MLKKVLRRLVQPLTIKQNPSPGSGYCNVLCADGNFRHCKPVLAAWLADCQEYSNTNHLEWHVCYWCKCQNNELGDYVHPDKQHPWGILKYYRMLSNANTKAANAELYLRHVHRELNVFRHIPCIVSNLLNPNLLHTMQICMLDHLQKWNFHFRKTHKQLDKYNAIWLSVPAYHNLTPKN